MKQKYESFTVEDAERLAKEGEKLTVKGFVKTDGFEKTVALLMQMTEVIWKITQENKSFRMELFYDAETLNTNYCFFTPTNQCALDDKHQEL